jgi:hypothetical protein
MNLINIRAIGSGAEAPEGLGNEGVDLVEEYLTRPVRCGRCGQVLSCNEWCDGAAEGCEDPACPMTDYEP